MTFKNYNKNVYKIKINKTQIDTIKYRVIILSKTLNILKTLNVFQGYHKTSFFIKTIVLLFN